MCYHHAPINITIHITFHVHTSTRWVFFLPLVPLPRGFERAPSEGGNACRIETYELTVLLCRCEHHRLICKAIKVNIGHQWRHGSEYRGWARSQWLGWGRRLLCEDVFIDCMFIFTTLLFSLLLINYLVNEWRGFKRFFVLHPCPSQQASTSAFSTISSVITILLISSDACREIFSIHCIRWKSIAPFYLLSMHVVSESLYIALRLSGTGSLSLPPCWLYLVRPKHNVCPWTDVSPISVFLTA